MDQTHKIFIVDDHKLFREALTLGLSQFEGFSIVGEASSGESFLDMLRSISVNIVLMDISLPGINGLETTEIALKMDHNLKIIVLTMFCDFEVFNKMSHAGVKGYVLKDAGIVELRQALKAVATGGQYYSQKLIQKILLNPQCPKTEYMQTRHMQISFTREELQILNLLCGGHSNSEISSILSISPKALEIRKSDMIKRTGVKDLLNLVIYCVKNGFVEANTPLSGKNTG